ncbi:prolyl oligopeptidase family serine peptidase [Halosquirtibacter laminarini]|uniref:Prolyl oligopeptidase family serine peptidase n=1 Tax=Halosquirtibacter laminarini TaxID=3374600 RepID=A0AC61NP97_9BACT|nr:prolyl oligopeptidase family serine peptidase [Prolixibacteraceae bacterium]
MNRIFTCIVALLLSQQLSVAQDKNTETKPWNIANLGVVHLPAFSSQGDINFKKTTFKKVLPTNHTAFDQISNNATLPWTRVQEESVASNIKKKNNLYLLETNINCHRWSDSKLELTVNNPVKVYLDQKMVKSYEDTAKTTLSIPMKLTLGGHHLTVVMANYQEAPLFTSTLKVDDSKLAYATTNSSYKRVLSLSDLLDGTKIVGASISPSGKYYRFILNDMKDGKSHYRYQIRELKTNRVVKEWRYESLVSWRWVKNSDLIVYGKKSTKGYDILSYNPVTSETKLVYEGIEKLYSFYISDNFHRIIYSKKTNKEKKTDLKRIYTPDDRIAGYRNRYGLRMIDLNSLQDIQLTSGYLTTSLQDISNDGKKILFSTVQQDCDAFPFYRTKVYEMNLNTFKLDTLYNEADGGISVNYTPDDSKLLVQAGATVFKGIGKNIQTSFKPNSYDSQLFLWNRTTKKVTPITKNFDPSIDSYTWTDKTNLYLLASNKDKKSLYHYDLKKNHFEELPTDIDVISQFSINKKGNQIIYYGSSITKDKEVYLYNIKSKKNRCIAKSANVTNEHLLLGKTEEFNFKNHNNVDISGRVYYPPYYDKTKKYPVIVYYYGGTSPTVRSFGGRYPKNLWAARGYMVYVLQPSGATGFGQNFSSYHVNGWGKDAIEDIIAGTKQFLKAHPSADAKNVGCIGASYGGFTTMMLQTRTDIFKTAISHAGISDITSYWGEGYWGYSYSTVAAAGSYPWNNKDLFVKQSPLYRADKFKNSILLIHGTADTNVPVGESKQYYLALKLLKKDAEMVLVDGENHWIMDYKKRKQWHQTIVSWFDFKLKGEKEQWESLYPAKQL